MKRTLRRAIAFALALLLCVTVEPYLRVGYAAIAFVASLTEGSTDSNGFTTSSIDTSGANLIIAGIAGYQGVAAPTVTDSKSNTWNTLNTYTQSTQLKTRISYCVNCTVGTGHTFTISGTGNYPSIVVLAVSGAHTASPFDQQNGATGDFVGSIQTGSVTPSLDNEIVFTIYGGAHTVTSTADSGFTAIANQTFVVGGQHYGAAGAYKIQTSAVAENPTWSLTVGNSADTAVAIATFKVDAGGGGGGSSGDGLLLRRVGW